MTLRKLPRLVFSILFLIFCSVGAARARDDAAEGSFERTLRVTGPVDVEVTTGSGHINVRTGEAGTVHVAGTIRVSTGWRITRSEAEDKVKRLEANPPIEQNGNTLRIGRIDDEDLRRNVSISYDLVVPADTRLHSETGSGGQTIDGIHGPLDAQTGSGNLTISKIGGEVHASTGSGGIELNTVQGNVQASTGSGSIRATGIAGGFSGHTGSGGVEVEQTAPGNTDIETGSGHVEVRGVRGGLRVRAGSGTITAEGAPTGEWRLRTGSGSVTVHLPENLAFDLYAHTSSGNIQTAHPITVEGSLSRREIHGKVRGGGVLVDISTSSGSIRVE